MKCQDIGHISITEGGLKIPEIDSTKFINESKNIVNCSVGYFKVVRKLFMIFKSRISGASLFEDTDRAGHATILSLRDNDNATTS